MHLMALIDTGYFVEHSFDRSKGDVYKRAFPFKDTGHVDAEGFCAYQHERKETENLKPAVGGHKKVSC